MTPSLIPLPKKWTSNLARCLLKHQTARRWQTTCRTTFIIRSRQLSIQMRLNVGPAQYQKQELGDNFQKKEIHMRKQKGLNRWLSHLLLSHTYLLSLQNKISIFTTTTFNNSFISCSCCQPIYSNRNCDVCTNVTIPPHQICSDWERICHISGWWNSCWLFRKHKWRPTG